MPLVAGVDSSTQSCKVVIRDAESGELVREGRATHPDGTEVAPEAWWRALTEAAAAAGGLADVDAVGVGGQQHGMVALDRNGEVVRPALLWNDTRSAPQALRLIKELGGPLAWAEATGSVPVASFTVTKLAWMAEHEPDNAARTAAVCLPHDWLTWRLAGGGGPAGVGLGALTTDRGDASGTGYFDAANDVYRMDLLEMGLGHAAEVPRVLPPAGSAQSMDCAIPGGAILSAGTGDNAAAALGLGAVSGDVIVSIGTSGVVSAISDVPACDPSGTVAGFADATGRFLPLVATLNAARVLSTTAALLGVDLDALSELALSAPSGSDGVVLVPYLDGERTPNRPDATGTLAGLTSQVTPAIVARAAVEGLLCGLADGIDALRAQGGDVRRVLLIGGGAKSEAVRRIAPAIFGVPVVVPPAGEYVADGGARQAAWALSGSDVPPEWAAVGEQTYDAEPQPHVRERYREAADLTLERHGR